MKTAVTFYLSLFIVTVVHAQHQHHSPEQVIPKEDTLNVNRHDNPVMSNAFSLNLPMNRNGSGTGWLPDSTPMFGYMTHAKKWMFMYHGSVFIRYTKTDIFNSGTRGSEKFDAVSWFMAMAQKRVGNKGLLRLSSMVSLDPLFGGNGYPLLFQTGESWKGRPLVDRQHPHDLFSELSAAYTYSPGENSDLYIYAGYPGEPALGSVAFMHRISALYNPDAPLSHHWNDGTHITYGVLTGGIRLYKFKFEASSFKGREPDENRYDLDKPGLDSYSGRISFNPDQNWSLQISQGHITSPEALRPAENVKRTTVSAIYSRPFSDDKFVNTTALWALNKSHGKEHAALIEATLLLNRIAVFGRYEFVQKSVHELDLDEAMFGHDEIFNINSVTTGMSYDISRTKGLRIAIGGQASFYSHSSALDEIYGKYPATGQVFIKLYPPLMMMRDH